MLGILRSNGQAADCMVSALRVTLSGTRLFKDCGYSIEWVSKPLPDGNYKLSFDSTTIDMRCFKGAWRATILQTGKGSAQATLGTVQGGSRARMRPSGI
jgi:hypothetical protein